MEVNEQEFIYPVYKDNQEYLDKRVLISVIIRAILQVIGLFGNVHLVFAVCYNHQDFRRVFKAQLKAFTCKSTTRVTIIGTVQRTPIPNQPNHVAISSMT
uniref:7TM_GPCR_Srx domain-containing protein n=1 Tax=Panagrellus redivivus TaxID=6233 RepID=A0A7E4US83_PANRE